MGKTAHAHSLLWRVLPSASFTHPVRLFAGRASASPSLDVLITLLSLLSPQMSNDPLTMFPSTPGLSYRLAVVLVDPFGGPVSRYGNERHMTVICLCYGRPVVEDGCSRSAYQSNRTSRLQSNAEAEKGSRSFIYHYVGADTVSVTACGYYKRSVTASRRKDDVFDTVGSQKLDYCEA